ncbi:MAG: hypothetical protein ABIK43_02005 [candidate division WOR-3 bacterium]
MENRDEKRRGTVDRSLLTALSYLPPFFFLPYLLPRPTRDERFHAVQALLLLGSLLGVAVVVRISDLLFRHLLGSIVIVGWYFSVVAWLIRYPLALCVVVIYLLASVLGATNAAAGRVWQAPIVGRLAERAVR